MDIGRRGHHHIQRQDWARPGCSSCCRIVACPGLESPVTRLFLVLVISDSIAIMTLKGDLLSRAPILCFNGQAWASRGSGLQARHFTCCKGVPFIYNPGHKF